MAVSNNNVSMEFTKALRETMSKFPSMTPTEIRKGVRQAIKKPSKNVPPTHEQKMIVERTIDEIGVISRSHLVKLVKEEWDKKFHTTTKKRAESSYSIFLTEKVLELSESYPEKTKKERLEMVREMWKQHKEGASGCSALTPKKKMKRKSSNK